MGRKCIHLALAILASFIALVGPAQSQIDLNNLVLVSPGDVSVVLGRGRFDRRSGNSFFPLTLTNLSGATLTAPIYVEVLSPVTLIDADAFAISGNGLYVIATDLAPGAVHQRTMSIAGRPRFTPAFNVYVAGAPSPGDVTPPVLAVESPADGVLTNGTPIEVAVRASDETQLAGVAVNGIAGVPEAGDPALFRASIPLAEGPNLITATAVDAAGNEASASLTAILDTLHPTLVVLSAPDLVAASPLALRVRATDPNGIESVAFDGIPASPDPGATDEYVAEVALDPGVNDVTLSATDRAGNVTLVEHGVSYDATAPTVQILEPDDGAVLDLAGVSIVVRAIDDVGVEGLTVSGLPAVQIGPETWTADRVLTEGPNVVRAEATDRVGRTGSDEITVTFEPPDLIPPVVTISSPSDGARVFDAQIAVAGTVDDDTATVTVNGIAATVTNGQWSVSGLPLALGANVVTAVAEDTAGNVGQVSIGVTREAVQLTGISVTPSGRRFDAADLQLALTVTAEFNDGSSVDVTADPTTSFQSDNPFVASVDAQGVVTARGNGEATVTARHQGLLDVAQITVEIGVTLDALGASPVEIILRNPTASRQLVVEGQFSDGTTRDLTAASSGTAYEATPSGIVSVDPSGLVTPRANGMAMVTASNAGVSAEVAAIVDVSAGNGFLLGEAYDDTLGLPLGGVTATLLADGGGPLGPAPAVESDDRGRFALGGLEGPAHVAVTRDGYTRVGRREVIPLGTARTLLDARLTPLDARSNTIRAAVGGLATDTGGAHVLIVPPGALAADLDLRLTPVGNQGLIERLPHGWSPAAAIDLHPAGIEMGQAATLRLPNALNLPAGSTLTAAQYNRNRGAWLVTQPATVTQDGTAIELEIARTDQFVVLLPDDPPGAPSAQTPGDALTGVAPAPLPDMSAAAGEVVPPSAPAGPDARARGRIALTPDVPIPSGTAVVGGVSEFFDLRSGLRAVPPPFEQDLLLYARPRGASLLTRSAEFPITPSQVYGIEELDYGRVTIDVGGRETAAIGSVLDNVGGVVEDGEAELAVPPGATPFGVVVALRTLDGVALPLSLPAGLDVLALLEVELGGAFLSTPALLSIPDPGGAGAIVLARLFSDPAGIPRLALVGLGKAEAGRIVADPVVDGLSLDGVTRGGRYVFLRTAQPLALVAGTVRGPAGSAAESALVTADSNPFADLTGSDGTFTMAGVADGTNTFDAMSFVTGDEAEATIAVGGVGTVTPLDLDLEVSAPQVVATTPADGATDVRLSASLNVTFSEPIDPLSIDPASVILTQADGTPVAVSRAQSSDRRRVIVTPDLELSSLSEYRLTVTSAIRDLGGNSLPVPVEIGFTTIDTTKPPQPEAGQIVATLPDQEGILQVVSTQGAAAPRTGVTVSNLDTQETFTALSQEDGSFRLNVGGAIGQELALTFRDPGGRETTVRIAQLEGTDGTVGLGEAGGSATDSEGRIASVLPGALSEPMLLRIGTHDAADRPALPPGFDYLDSFELTLDGGRLRRIEGLTLEESQDRFPTQFDDGFPFEARGTLVVPLDFIVNGTLKFEARVEAEDGHRTELDAATLVVGTAPDVTPQEVASGERFPTLYLNAPLESLPNQQLEVTAIAPTARVDLNLPGPPLAVDAQLFLARVTELAGSPVLSVVDRLETFDDDGQTRLRTTGRDLPGAALGGTYVVVQSAQPLVAVTGRNTGAEATVALGGTPFVFETRGPNGGFQLPVVAGTSFTLAFLDPTTGLARGEVSDTAPSTGQLDVGEPLGTAAGTLLADARPGSEALVDIDADIVIDFDQPIDAATLSDNFLVTDAAGKRVFGRTALSQDDRRLVFTPLRRWGFGRTYRYTVSRGLLAETGARLAQPLLETFTTFAPASLAATATGVAKDVAVSGHLGLLATDAGLSVLDVGHADAPVVVSQVALAGGAGGVAMIDAPAFTDRNGDPVPGPIGIVVSGDEAHGGRLGLYSLADPTMPVLLGSAGLSTPLGAIPAAGVPDGPGTPNAVVVTPDTRRAFVAVRGIGVVGVDLREAIPDDPAQPGRAVGPRSPAAELPSANDVAWVKDQVLVAGPSGLSVLDGETLALVGSVSTSGEARGVDVLADFELDLEGDGRVDPEREVLDLAVVANGVDGTVQYFDLGAPGSPALISVARLPHSANGVALSRSERLAYVAGAANGVALVDLLGPISIQPIDLDRDNRDDRILGTASTSGASARVAPAVSRGVGFVADGPGGLAVLQLTPPRVAFAELRRDPIAGLEGDDERLGDPARAYVTDSAIVVEVVAAIPPQTVLYLTIDEPRPAGVDPLLTFSNGSIGARLEPGENTFLLPIAGDGGGTGRSARLRIEDAAGATIAERSVSLVPPDFPPEAVASLFVVPDELVMPPDQASGQLSVAGVLDDGRIVNLTGAQAGTTYDVEDPAIATVDPGGGVTALAAGATRVVAQNGPLAASGSVEVQGPAAITEISVLPQAATLTLAGETLPLVVTGRLSYGALQDITEGFGVQYDTSDPTVVTVDPQGVVSAVGDGTATITITSDTLVATVAVAVELRTPPVVSGIELSPLTDVFSDVGSILLEARLAGTGSLEGLAVTFTPQGLGGAPITVTSEVGGVAAGMLEGLVIAGTGSVTASVVDPDSGLPLSDTQALTVIAAGDDLEPNDDHASAVVVNGATVSGSVGGSDGADVFGYSSTTDATLTISLELPESADPGAIEIVVRDAGGAEMARFTPAAADEVFELDVLAGDVTVGVESAGAPVDYQLITAFNAAPVTITSVVPSSGGRGTLVTIAGSGFSTEPAANLVFFGGIGAKVVAASRNELQALVPAAAVNGPVGVTVGAGSALGPEFDAGNAIPPSAELTPPDPAMARVDPVSGVTLIANRLLVRFDPGIDRSQVETLAAGFGGSVVGYLPSFNDYELEFGAIATVTGILEVGAQLAARPEVLSTVPNQLLPSNGIVIVPDSATRLDLRDGAQSSKGLAYELIDAYDALEAVRVHESFTDPTNLKSVRVAVVDTGFDPIELAGEYTLPGGSVPVKLLNAVNPGPSPNGLIPVSPVNSDPGGHGTLATGVIAALNNLTAFNGLLAGTYQKAEMPRFEVLVYRCQTAANQLPLSGVLAALTDIAKRNNMAGLHVDVVNLSFGVVFGSPGNLYRQTRAAMQPSLAALAPRSLVVAAANNQGVEARFDLPAAFAASMPHVVSVGGVAVENRDGTGELADRRAIFRVPQQLPAGFPDALQCESRKRAGSGCGPEVLLAAAGEDVLTTNARVIGGPGLVQVNGNSFAAPMVSAAAAILQSIRPMAQPFLPPKVRQILIDTADDISSTWDPGDMRRLNLLSAVRAVLSAEDKQFIYVADREADDDPTDGIPGGKIVGVDVDPMTGSPLPTAKESLTSFIQGGRTFLGTRPGTVRVSPDGNYLWAIVEGDAARGDGVLVLDTQALKPLDFVAFCGARFPAVCGGTLPKPIRLTSSRPGLVFSLDGRLAYAATGTRITIFNAVNRSVVRTWADLPPPYDARASRMNATPLSLRVGAAELLLSSPLPPANRIASTLGDLALSPDGRFLYAVIETGGGLGRQPGGLQVINVDLYRDADPLKPGLQSDLSNYFKTGTPAIIALSQPPPNSPMPQIPEVLFGDEPKAVAASPDGKRVYLVNGGVNFFQGLPPDRLDVSRYINMFGLSMMGAQALGTAGGLGGMMAGLNGFTTQTPQLFQQLQDALIEQMNAGRTLVSAQGNTDVYSHPDGTKPVGAYMAPPPGPDPAPEAIAREWSFPANVVFGWNPSPSGGGRIINQFSLNEVYASRPFDLAIRPDGVRGIMPYYQTGNAGVVDLFHQLKFRTLPPDGPNPGLANVSDEMFLGVVGVTPALRLDNHLWPRRGVFRSFRPGEDFLTTLPSPDEALLFTWDAEYAQNGRFAVMSHVGSGTPRDMSLLLPDFENEFVEARLPLLELGYTYTGGNTITAPDGTTHAVGDLVTFPRGGGGVTIIDDLAIDADFTGNVPTVSDVRTGIPRAYYSQFPICKTNAPDLPLCTTPGTKALLGYDTDTQQDLRFHRPRGIAVQPFVTFDSPLFGDHIGPGDAVQVRWRDSRITHISFAFYQYDPATGDFVFRGESNAPLALTAGQRSQKVFKQGFSTLYRQTTGFFAVDTRRYRIEVRVCLPGQACKRVPRFAREDVFSTNRTEATFEQPASSLACNTHISVAPDPLEMLFGSRKQLFYRITLGAGDALNSHVVVEVVEDPNLADLAVDITQPTLPSSLAGDPIVKILQTRPAGTRFAKNDFEIDIAFSTVACGQQTKTVPVRVISNTKRGQDEIVTTLMSFPDLDNACDATAVQEGLFLIALRPRLKEALGFDALVHTPAQFPPGIAIMQEFPNGARVVYQVLHSTAVSDLDSTTADSGTGNPQVFQRGPRQGPAPIFDPQAGDITNRAQLVGTNIDLVVSQGDQKTAPPGAPSVCRNHTVKPPNRPNQFVLKYIFGVNMQVQQLDP